MNSERKTLLTLIYTALFIALCFAGTSIAIPFGASKVHLGNFFCILAGLLSGPLVGGIAGSVGMGLSDLMLGYAWTTTVRTFVLKFLMGFLVGWIFRLLLRKNAKGTPLLFVVSGISLALFVYSLVTYFTAYNATYSLALVILSSILLFLALLTLAFSFKLSPVNKCLSFALVLALSVNVVGEFFLRFFINLIVGMDAGKAMLTSYTKLPAALLTSIVTILGIALLFYPVYYATEKLNGLNDLAPYLPRRKKKEEGEK